MVPLYWLFIRHCSKIIFTTLPHYINSSVCYGVERTVNELDRLTIRTVTVRWTFNLIIAHIINLISQFYLLGINKKQFYFVDKCCNLTLFWVITCISTLQFHEAVSWNETLHEKMYLWYGHYGLGKLFHTFRASYLILQCGVRCQYTM